MPENTCLEHAGKEITSRAGLKGETSGLAANDPAEHGEFRGMSYICIQQLTDVLGLMHFHTNMLADPKGARQSVTLHCCHSTDECFSPFPRVRGTVEKSECSVCVDPGSHFNIEVSYNLLFIK